MKLLFMIAGWGLAMVILGARRADTVRLVAALSAIASFIVSICLGFTISPDVMILTSQEWIPGLGVRFVLGIEPIGYLMIWVTAFSVLLGVAAALRDMEGAGSSNQAAHFACIFIIQIALYLVFIARDLLLFFVAYESVLIPMYLMILKWGGRNRVHASIKFVVFTLFGSLPMLLSIAVIGVRSIKAFGHLTFEFDKVAGLGLTMGFHDWQISGVTVPFPDTGLLVFLGFALAFLVKTPLWPLHTWLPDAHTEAPTSGSIILAGVLLKMGTYGLAVIAIPLFPEAARVTAPLLQILAVCGIVFGALGAFAQTDAKRLVAYSSVSHMGFVVLGLFCLTAEGYLGSVMQMAAHGVATGAMFYFIGALYRRRHDRALTSFGGLATSSPGFAVWAAITIFASMALPGTAGFAAEVMILFGAMIHKPFLVLLAAPAVVCSAAYMLKFAKAVLFSDSDPEFARFWKGPHGEEMAILVASALILIAAGVAPHGVVYARISSSVATLLGVFS